MSMINIINNEDSYLTGKLLVATPIIKSDSPFYKSVIFVVSHNNSASLGIIVNSPISKPNSLNIINSFHKNNVMIQEGLEIYFGGPSETNRGFILHSNDYIRTPLFKLSNGISLSSSVEILNDMANGNGPSQTVFAVGCAGWAAGQLEEEMSDNSWLIAPFSEKIVFGNNNSQKWDLAMENIGVKNYSLSMHVGHA